MYTCQLHQSVETLSQCSAPNAFVAICTSPVAFACNAIACAALRSCRANAWCVVPCVSSSRDGIELCSLQCHGCVVVGAARPKAMARVVVCVLVQHCSWMAPCCRFDMRIGADTPVVRNVPGTSPMNAAICALICSGTTDLKPTTHATFHTSIVLTIFMKLCPYQLWYPPLALPSTQSTGTTGTQSLANAQLGTGSTCPKNGRAFV